MSDIVKFGFCCLVLSFQALTDLIDFTFYFLIDSLDIVILLLNIILLSSNIVKLSLCCIKVSCQLLQISLLSEECFCGSSILVIQNLFSLKISSLSTLHELVTIVLISNLQVRQSIKKSLDLLLTFLYFTIKLISLSLKFFFDLLTLDDIVSL